MKKLTAVLIALILCIPMSLISFAESSVKPIFSFDFADGENGVTLQNAELVNDSVRGQVLQIKGTGPDTLNTSYASFTDNDGIIEKTDWTNGLTISLWVRNSNPEPASNLIVPIFDIVTLDELGTGDDDSWGFCAITTSLEMAINTNGNNFESGLPRGWYNPSSLENAISYDDWTHVAVTMGDDGIIIYVNGLMYGLCMINELDAFGLISEIAISKTLMFGSWKNNYWNHGDYEGYIDDVKILNYALSEDDIAALYEAEDGGESVSEIKVSGVEITTENETRASETTVSDETTQAEGTTASEETGSDVTTAPETDKESGEDDGEGNTALIIIIAAAAAVVIAGIIIFAVKKKKK